MNNLKFRKMTIEFEDADGNIKTEILEGPQPRIEYPDGHVVEETPRYVWSSQIKDVSWFLPEGSSEPTYHETGLAVFTVKVWSGAEDLQSLEAHFAAMIERAKKNAEEKAKAEAEAEAPRLEV
jgi:hypothetical protein